jgi:hypothetical protein
LCLGHGRGMQDWRHSVVLEVSFKTADDVSHVVVSGSCSIIWIRVNWKTDTRCSVNAWASFSVGLLAQVPCCVWRGGEGFVACYRYLVVFHKE